MAPLSTRTLWQLVGASTACKPWLILDQRVCFAYLLLCLLTQLIICSALGCLCDDQDIGLLRTELAKGKEFLRILDEMLASLPPSYALAAKAVAEGKSISQVRKQVQPVVREPGSLN